MPDRVKAAIFSMLGAYYELPGQLPPLTAADVFAGSGSMGLEALSRGAATCYFFERQRIALDALKENVENLNASDLSTIVTRDAWRSSLVDGSDRPFDLILLDPPYKDSLDTSPQGRVRRYLHDLADKEVSDTLIVLHHQAPNEWIFDAHEPWRVMDHRTFGSNAITMITQ